MKTTGAHPSNRLIDLSPQGAPFDIAGQGAAVLLIHGFTGTPAEVRPIGDMISARLGWRAKGILLPGHGTWPNDLESKQWTDWLDAIDLEFMTLRQSHQKIHLLGSSMGALLSIEMFRRKPNEVASLVLMAAPIYLGHWRYRLQAFVLSRFPWLTTFMKEIRKNAPPHPLNVAYPFYPTRAASEFEKLRQRVKGMTPTSSPPLFLAYSRRDKTASVRSSRFLIDHLTTRSLHEIYLEEEIHTLALGHERERLFEELFQFYRER